MADHAGQAGGVDASVCFQHGANCFSKSFEVEIPVKR